ncbi:MAG: transcriptional repressor [Deltaproteobacteria bacterium]|nr:transcriptional repressor [Deltaproteobacteria bacterium]
MSTRRTRQLEVIWEAVKGEMSHPTADQIYDRVRKDMPHISLGTVYRNLQKLAADGKLQILTIDRTQHFDPLLKKHPHFICESCGKVYDVTLDRSDEAAPVLSPETGFTVTSHQLSLYGTCEMCS